MGRWSQRRRAGGDAQILNEAFIIEVTRPDNVTASIAYNIPVDASTLNPAAFFSNPSTAEPNSLAQAGTNQVDATFLDDILSDTSIQYIGITPGFKSPDSRDYE